MAPSKELVYIYHLRTLPVCVALLWPLSVASSPPSPSLHPRYATAYAQPDIDADEGVSDATVTRENGRTIMDFVRPLVSTDDQDISLNQCVFHLYAANGGAVSDFASRTIAYHDRTPLVSPSQVCLPQPGQCTGRPGMCRHHKAESCIVMQ